MSLADDWVVRMDKSNKRVGRPDRYCITDR